MPARSPAPSCWKTACSRRWRCWPRCAALWQFWLAHLDVADPADERPQLLPAPAGPQPARQLEDAAPRAAAGAVRRQRLHAHPGRVPRHPPAGAARPRLGGAAHACRRRQRAHQHPRQQRQLRHAADGARGGGAHHGAGAPARRRDQRRARHRHHQARIPDRRRTAALRRLQGAHRPRRPLQQGQAAARAGRPATCRPRTSAPPTRRASASWATSR